MCSCKRVFIDANIFIDANDDSRVSYKASYQIVPYLLSQQISIYTSCDLITTIYYILSKKDKLKALSSIEQLNKICKIIDFSNKDVAKTCALMRDDTDYTDLEDTMQYILAKRENCEMIVSNDKRFISKDIPLFTSIEFCERYIIDK